MIYEKISKSQFVFREAISESSKLTSPPVLSTSLATIYTIEAARAIVHRNIYQVVERDISSFKEFHKEFRSLVKAFLEFEIRAI